MKILIVDTYYPGFLKSFWKNNQKVRDQSWSQQVRDLMSSCFGTSDYYSHHLNQLGHKAREIVVNDVVSQTIWARENGLDININSFLSKIKALPYMRQIFGEQAWIQQVVLAQVEKYQPDVVYVQDLSVLSPKTLRTVKSKVKLLVGQIACPLPPTKNLKAFDLILTSFPHYVKVFRDLGINSEYFKIGFDSRALKKVDKLKRIYDVSFIGSFSPHHQAGTKILEKLARSIPVHVWGRGIESLSHDSPLRANYHGEAWGLEMYRILSQSKIVINRHISAAEDYANNMRLYESTGMGAMLITDHKKNLAKLFKLGIEIESYRNPEELIKKASYYLENKQKRKTMAHSGQSRTLKDHTYEKRMGELSQILQKYL